VRVLQAKRFSVEREELFSVGHARRYMALNGSLFRDKAIDFSLSTALREPDGHSHSVLTNALI
jgi:hypothetical protein